MFDDFDVNPSLKPELLINLHVSSHAGGATGSAPWPAQEASQATQWTNMDTQWRCQNQSKPYKNPGEYENGW